MKKIVLLFCCLFVYVLINAQKPFITTWNTANAGVSANNKILFHATGDNFHIGWVNMNNAADTGNATGNNGADTVTFPAAGIYKVYITPGGGTFTAILMDGNSGDHNKLLSIEQWGDIHWATFDSAFSDCFSMVINATDKPDLSRVKSMALAFFNCASLTTNTALSNWDVSNVTNMKSTFQGATKFNEPLDNWNVNKVTDMSAMFYHTQSFNQPLANWNVSNVTNMSYMFADASLFNQPIGNWNVSNVTDMSYMFSESAFNQTIGNWNVSKVTNMAGMFSENTAFNQPIANWDVSNVTIMSDMFASAQSFNQPIGNWSVGKVLYMSDMFGGTRDFNQPISNWNVSSVTDMSNMFTGTVSFNQPINNWNVSNATNMSGMFAFAQNFNQPIGNWNVSNVTNMNGIFKYTQSFNQPIGNWNISKVTDLSEMFYGTSAFNQPLNNWDLSSAVNLIETFSNSKAFNQPLNKWNVNKVTNMSYIFQNAVAFNQDIGSWNLSGASNIVAMFDNSGMSCSNYSKTLQGWANNSTTPNGLSLGAANLIYDSATAKAAHDSLTMIKGWTITGDKIGQCSILPVSFISFTSTQQNNTAILNWKVANEINVKGYDVEKSSNSINFNTIGFVSADEKITDYNYTDNNIIEGNSYYRIKEVDNDGKFMYSSIQKIAYSTFAWKIIGNPINSNSSISLMLDKSVNVSVQIISSTGNIIKAINKGNITSGSYNIPLNMNSVSPGMYLIRLMIDDKAYTATVIK